MALTSTNAFVPPCDDGTLKHRRASVTIPPEDGISWSARFTVAMVVAAFGETTAFSPPPDRAVAEQSVACGTLIICAEERPTPVKVNIVFTPLIAVVGDIAVSDGTMTSTATAASSGIKLPEQHPMSPPALMQTLAFFVGSGVSRVGSTSTVVGPERAFDAMARELHVVPKSTMRIASLFVNATVEGEVKVAIVATPKPIWEGVQEIRSITAV